MSQFNQQLALARKRQHRMYLWLLSTAILVLLVMVMIIFASRGTRIEVQPVDATEVTIETDSWLSMALFGSVYSLIDRTEMTISATGFYPHRQAIEQPDFGKVLSVTLTPLPATIRLATSLEDNQTTWMLGEQRIGTGNTLEYELPAGEHQILVQHPHYQPVTVELNLNRGETVTRDIELPSLVGELTVLSVPTGASVIVDGNEAGNTPLTYPLEGGWHQVTLSLDKYESTEERVEVTFREPELERNYRLLPETAGINVDLQPTGGQLTLNGLRINSESMIPVAAGQTHTLTYSKPGFFPHTETFTLKGKEKRQINFNLQKATGKLAVNSSPPAEVSVAGKAVGTTPIELELQTVPHEITLRLDGYRSQSKTVTPSTTAPQQLSFTLIPEEQARLQEAPRRYQNKAGGEMLLFFPNDIIHMGAGRDEPGQRANEFLKQVRLNRPFYAGINEVSNAEFQQFDNSHSGDPELPVTNVSWLDAIKFANWLSQQEGLTVVYQLQGNQLTRININANGYRLLMEAEWEWLARKAGKSAQTLFVWGNERTIPARAVNIADESAKGSVSLYVPRYQDGYAGIAPVRSFRREVSGLYDLGGNVSEWTHDSYSLIAPKSDSVYSHALDDSLLTMRVIKGANWRSGSLSELRASYRDGAEEARDTLGFRVGRFLNGGNE